jgi:5-methylcytosine-specific restriction endonuclease McrA
VTEPPECGYCGAPGTTTDHVPSRKFFPRPRPSDLVTVPACARCNNKTSADEEYFLNIMMAHVAAEGPIVDALRKQRFTLRNVSMTLRHRGRAY